MKRKRLLVVLALFAVALCVLSFTITKPSSNALEGSGTVESRNVRVGSKVGGRISEVRVREGENVKSGQILVTFDEQELLEVLSALPAAAAKPPISSLAVRLPISEQPDWTQAGSSMFLERSAPTCELQLPT